MYFAQVIEVVYVSYATGLSNPVNPDPLLLHDLLHVHVPGEPPRLLHRGLRRQEERDADQDGDGHELAEQDGLVGLEPAVVGAAVVLVRDADYDLNGNLKD